MKKGLFLFPLMLIGLVGCNNNEDRVIKFDYIFTAQPVVFATSSKGYQVSNNVQTDFSTKTSGKRIIQASVFINKNTSVNKASLFLEKLQSDITNGVADPNLIKIGIAKAGSTEEQQSIFGVPAGAAYNVTLNGNGFSLGFEYSKNIKSEVSDFVSLMNPTITTISDEYYFTPNITDREESFDDLKIVCPSGAPAVAFYNHAQDPNFETAAPIPALLGNNYQVVVAPTHGGMDKLINANANFQLAATITFGNMYILSTGRDKDGVMNRGDNVLFFQENDLPGKVFKYLYGDLGLKTVAVSDAQSTKNIIENDGIMKQ